MLESQVENHQPYDLFKVAKKETLTVFTTNESDPYKLSIGTYTVILFETKLSKLKVRVYFVTSKGKSNFNFRQSSDYLNVGRSIKKENWEDLTLSSVNSYQTYDLSNTQEALENPIYRVKEVKSNEVVLIDTDTKETVKILASRKYSPQIIYFHNQYKPQVKAYKKTNLNAFF